MMYLGRNCGIQFGNHNIYHLLPCLELLVKKWGLLGLPGDASTDQTTHTLQHRGVRDHMCFMLLQGLDSLGIKPTPTKQFQGKKGIRAPR